MGWLGLQETSHKIRCHQAYAISFDLCIGVTIWILLGLALAQTHRLPPKFGNKVDDRGWSIHESPYPLALVYSHFTSPFSLLSSIFKSNALIHWNVRNGLGRKRVKDGYGLWRHSKIENYIAKQLKEVKRFIAEMYRRIRLLQPDLRQYLSIWVDIGKWIYYHQSKQHRLCLIPIIVTAPHVDFSS